MTCRDCEKRLNPETDFCPKCGLLVKAPTAAESRDVEKNKAFIFFPILGIICLLVFVLLPVLLADESEKIPVFWLAFKYVGLPVSIFFFLLTPAAISFIAWRRRQLPLIKRAVEVYDRWEGGVGARNSYYLKFRLFRGHYFVARVARSDYKKCGEGQRVIVKYKVIGKKQKFVLYGVEYFD